MLDAQEFAEALRLGMLRSGLAEAKAAQANYLPLAMAVVEYLKTHLQITLPEGALVIDGDPVANAPASCEVS